MSRPTSKAGRLQRALLALYEEHVADGTSRTGGRFLWYELVARGVVDKAMARGHPGVKGRGVDQDVTDALLHLRVIGAIPWRDIVDGTRTHQDFERPGRVDEVDNEVDEHTVELDPWGGKRPIVLVESRQAAGVLEDAVYKYRCAISGLGGQVHGHVVTEVVPLLRDGCEVLYVGDHDLSGDQIQGNVERLIERHKPPGMDVTVTRIALTQEQVDALGLEPILKTDERYHDHHRHLAVELEAMGQRRLVEVVRAELDARLPGPMPDVRVQETRTVEMIE